MPVACPVVEKGLWTSLRYSGFMFCGQIQFPVYVGGLPCHRAGARWFSPGIVNLGSTDTWSQKILCLCIVLYFKTSLVSAH